MSTSGVNKGSKTVVFVCVLSLKTTKPLGKPSHWVCKPLYLVPVPSQDKLGGLRQEGHRHKNGEVGGGSLISPDGVAPSQIVGVSAADISPCIISQEEDFFRYRHPGSPGKSAIERLYV